MEFTAKLYFIASNNAKNQKSPFFIENIYFKKIKRFEKLLNFICMQKFECLLN